MAATNGKTGQIPVIDLSGSEETVAKELVDAAATYGFVYIKSLGNDIPVEAIDSIFALVMPLKISYFDRRLTVL
jgi:isopenicillin N synthase-like dioxygenase